MAEEHDGLDLGGLLPLLLGALGQEEDTEPDSTAGGGDSGFDPSVLPGLLAALSAFTSDDEQVRLLRALKPMLSPERQSRMDGAVKICRLASALPALKDSGILGKLL